MNERVEAVVDDLINVVLDVALVNQARTIRVVEFVWTYGIVGQLIQEVTFECVTPGGRIEWGSVGLKTGCARVESGILLFEIIGDGRLVGQHQNDLLVQFLDDHVGRIRARYNFKAVVEQRLRFVVGNPQQLHGSEGITGFGAGKDHAHGNVVVVAGFERKGPSRLQEESVSRGVACSLLCPGFGFLANGSPLIGIGVTGVHVVSSDVEVGARTGGNAIASVSHALAVFPEAPHIIVVVHALAGLAIDATGPVVVKEFAHPKALVVDHAISVSNANAGVGYTEGVDGIGEDAGQWIVDAIGILVRAFKEINAHGGGLFAVSDRITRGLIEGVAVVAVTQSTLDVTAHIVVDVSAEVAIDPLGEVGVGEGLRALVHQDVVAERHVVDLVVGRKREALGPDFHANGLAQRLGVDVAFVVEDPVVRLVSIEGHTVLSPAVATIDFLQEIIPWVIAQRRVIIPVSIVIVKWGEIVVLTEGHVAVRWIVKEVGGNGVAFWELCG